MAEPSDKENDTSKKYHHHPLFPHLPLKEAVRKGLAIPAKVYCDDEELARDNIQLKRLRPTKTTDDLRQEFSKQAYKRHDIRTSASPPTAGKDASELNNKSPHGITRYSGKPPKPLRKVFSLGAMRGVNSTKSMGSLDAEVDENVKKEIRERVQETAQELRDRLGIHGPVPIPAPLNIPQKKIPKPTLARIDENKRNSIGNRNITTEQIASPSTAQPYHSRLPRYKPQVKPHPTPTSQAKTQEEDFVAVPARSSSALALASAFSPHPPIPTTNRAGIQNKTLKTTSSTPLLGSFDQDLPELPRHLRPGNQYSPRLCPSATPHISFAASENLQNHETGETIATPLKPGRKSRIPQKTGRNQSTSPPSPSSSICSFTGENRQLEADILALLDNMASARNSLLLPPPGPPPDYPPPPPPPFRRSQLLSAPASAAAVATPAGSPGSATVT
ncbi:hypothetical protein GGR51DRAFT_578009 [Nemania sp. FL0031]|nr:hypothetical protein GGR51DRAFT_578009 [Nemania sp. FL0031]